MMLSVRLQCYNHGLFIEKALQSIISQETSFCFEIVIGDDFSTDNTIEIIEKVISENMNSKVKFNLLKRKQGDIYSINRKAKGRLYNFYDILNNCQGKYIALLDGDDYWTNPLKLQKQVDFLEANLEVNICFHRAQVLRDNELVTHKTPPLFITKSFGYIDLLKHNNFIVTASTVFRKPQNFNIPDWFCKISFGDLGLYKLVTKNSKIYCLDEIMCVYRVHNGGLYSGISLLMARQNYLSFYKTIFPHLNTAEKQVVKIKIKEKHKEIAKIKFSKSKWRQKCYYVYLRLHDLFKS